MTQCAPAHTSSVLLGAGCCVHGPILKARLLYNLLCLNRRKPTQWEKALESNAVQCRRGPGAPRRRRDGNNTAWRESPRGAFLPCCPNSALSRAAECFQQLFVTAACEEKEPPPGFFPRQQRDCIKNASAYKNRPQANGLSFNNACS